MINSLDVRGVYKLPFVYVFGRSQFTVSFFGANVFPENITVALEQPTIKEWVTGKFVLEIKEDKDHNRYMHIVVEETPSTGTTTVSTKQKEEAIINSIVFHLKRLNSEFANYVPPEKQKPTVLLLPSGHSEYFPVGVKHRYTRK